VAKDLINLDGGAINDRRVLRGLTREELARRARVSPNRVRLALRGGPIGLAAARAVVRALRMRLVDVVVDGRGLASRSAGTMVGRFIGDNGGESDG
jgi:transcriptional regulator with XRE-family HTH domain